MQVAITDGNQIHIVWEAYEQIPKGIWYATGRVKSNYIPPEEYPATYLTTPLSTQTPSDSIIVSKTITPTIIKTETVYSLEKLSNNTSPLLPLFFAVGSTSFNSGYRFCLQNFPIAKVKG